jgi:Holliday junction resolvase RusA-like endonuclease
MVDIVVDVLGHDFIPIEGDLSVDLELVITRPKQTKLTAPRADIDNFVKAVFDALNGYLWEDDRQILKLYAVKQWAEVGEEGYFTIGVDRLVYRDKT